MINYLRMRCITYEGYRKTNAVTIVPQIRIPLSTILPRVSNGIVVGFVQEGRCVLIVNTDSVEIAEFFPLTALSRKRMYLDHHSDSPLQEKRFVIIAHEDSSVVATIVTCEDLLDNPNGTAFDVRLRLFRGCSLLYDKLVSATLRGHYIYKDYYHSENQSSVVVVNGGFQLLFFLVEHTETNPKFLNCGVRLLRDSLRGSCLLTLREPFPCQSKWVWSSLSSCRCRECVAIDGGEDLGGTIVQVQIDCDILATTLIRRCYPSVSLTPSNFLSETRVIGPCADTGAILVALAVSFCYQERVLFMVWLLAILPWTYEAAVLKIEDLAQFARQNGHDTLPPDKCLSRALHLQHDIDRYVDYLRKRDPHVLGWCNSRSREFVAPSLSGVVRSVTEFKHPLTPFVLFNDEFEYV